MTEIDGGWAVTRCEPQAGIFPMLAAMHIERGSKDDWEALHEFHYKSDGSSGGGRFYRIMFGERLAGVAMFRYPRGLLRDRHRLFPDLGPEPGRDTHLTNVYRFKYLNQRFTLNARTVCDPLFRGIGLGYRLLNLASRMEGREYCEIQSSMSRFNEFAHRAGYRFVTPSKHGSHDEIVALYARWFDSNPIDQITVVEEFERMKPAIQTKVLAEMKRTYWKNSALSQTGKNLRKGMATVEHLTIKEVVKGLNQLAFASPLYGVYKNPDFGRELPARLPILAFDWQGVNEPLNLERMDATH